MQAYLPEISLIALAVAVVIGIVRNVNVGPLSMAIALVIGYYIGGVKIRDLIAGYPVNVFIMLAGITYLFAIANINGTLVKLTNYAVKGVRGNVAMLPIILFILAFALSSLGPGAITICALMAAPCMLLASQTKIPAFLMAVMVANGTQAGNMSPIAVAGVIVKGLAEKMNLPDWSFILWMNSLVYFFAIGIGAYLLFGGLKLWKQSGAADAPAAMQVDVEPFTRQQYLTLAGIAALVIGVIFFKVDIGFFGFLVGTVLILLGAADEDKVFKAMPWGAIMMVTGVTVLINLMSKIGGMALFAEIMAKQSTPSTGYLGGRFLVRTDLCIRQYDRRNFTGICADGSGPSGQNRGAEQRSFGAAFQYHPLRTCDRCEPLVHTGGHFHSQRHGRPGPEEVVQEHAHLGLGHDTDRRHRLLVFVHRLGYSMTGDERALWSTDAGT